MSGSIGGSFVLAPASLFQFTNSSVGDLVIRGINGGLSQKVLIGTTSNADATMSITPSNITTFGASFSLSNAGGQVVFTPSNAMLGVNNVNPRSTLDVVGTVTISSDTVLLGATTLSNTLLVTQPATLNSNLLVQGFANFSNVTTLTSNLIAQGDAALASNLSVAGTSLLSSNLVVVGAANFSNATTLTSTLAVAGAASLTSNLTVGGSTLLSSNVNVLGAANFSNATTLTSTLAVAGAASLTSNLTVAGSTLLSSNLDVVGAANFSNATTLTSTLAVAGAASLTSNLTVAGSTLLSSNLDVVGAANFSNATTLTSTLAVAGAASLTSNLTVAGSTLLSSNLDVVGAANFSNATTLVGAVTVLGATTLSNSTVVYGTLTASNSAVFASNLTVLGSLNATTVNYAYSNVTIYNSEQVASNLIVDGTTSMYSALTLVSSNATGADSNLSPVLALSNSSGYAFLQSKAGFLGVDTSNPAYTLDVAGDINLTGRVFQNGAVFSSWKSNADGNYLTSNAAFLGPATATDVLVLYNSNGTFGSNMAFTLSNPTGATSIYNTSNLVGVNQPNPAYTVDVNGDINFSGSLFQNGAVFSAFRSNVYGNYITSNVAFLGPATPSDVLVVYTSNTTYGSNMAMSFSNDTTKASWYCGAPNFLGLNNATPVHMLDVGGDVHATGAITTPAQIGVGTANPGYPIDVETNSNGVSIYCTSKVMASEFTVYSDRRIKTDITPADAPGYLDALTRLSVCQFSYLDPASKGAGSRIGFIAQEVEAVLPSCVSPTTDVVPNVLAHVPVASQTVAGAATLDLSGLPAAAVEALALASSSGSGPVTIKTRVGANIVYGTLTSASDPAAAAPFATLATFQVQGDAAQLPAGTTDVFVFGVRVDDFRTLSYEQLGAVAIASIQAQQLRITALETAVAKLVAA
jgi:hypothetical protein